MSTASPNPRTEEIQSVIMETESATGPPEQFDPNTQENPDKGTEDKFGLGQQ